MVPDRTPTDSLEFSSSEGGGREQKSPFSSRDENSCSIVFTELLFASAQVRTYRNQTFARDIRVVVRLKDGITVSRHVSLLLLRDYPACIRNAFRVDRAVRVE